MTQTTDLRGIVPERGRGTDPAACCSPSSCSDSSWASSTRASSTSRSRRCARTCTPPGPGCRLVVAGYIISYAVLLIVGARLGALAGHRRLFHLGLAGFYPRLAGLRAGAVHRHAGGLPVPPGRRRGAADPAGHVHDPAQLQRRGAARALSLYSAVIAGAIVVGQAAGACWSPPTCSAPDGGRSSSSTCPSGSRCCSPGRASCPATRACRASATCARSWTCRGC